MRPKVSILIPVFNRADMLSRCVESALRQTYQNIEIIIVDNASNDGTWSICQALALNDNRIRVYRNQENIGPVKNWMRCAELATGELSKILFSDDMLELNCLEKMVPHLEQPDIAFVYSTACIGNEESSYRAYFLGKRARLLDVNTYLKMLINNRAPVSPGAVLLRTSDVIRNLHTDFESSTIQPYSSHGAGPDVMLLMLTADNYKYVKYLPESLVLFRIHDGSFTIKNTQNLVKKGYVSAISFYMRKVHNKKYIWLVYMGRSWLNELKSNRKWINPVEYLRSNEGSGQIYELLGMYIFTAFDLIFRGSRSLINLK